MVVLLKTTIFVSSDTPRGWLWITINSNYDFLTDLATLMNIVAIKMSRKAWLWQYKPKHYWGIQNFVSIDEPVLILLLLNRKIMTKMMVIQTSTDEYLSASLYCQRGKWCIGLLLLRQQQCQPECHGENENKFMNLWSGHIDCNTEINLVFTSHFIN